MPPVPKGPTFLFNFSLPQSTTGELPAHGDGKAGLSRDRPPHMPLDLTCKPPMHAGKVEIARGGWAREREWVSCREHRRAVVGCCRRLRARAPRCTERVGESRSHLLLRRWVLLSTARLQEVATRPFSLSRVPRSPLCFSCAHRRVAVARAVVREAKRQQRRRRSVRGWWEGADTTKREATAP